MARRGYGKTPVIVKRDGPEKPKATPDSGGGLLDSAHGRPCDQSAEAAVAAIEKVSDRAPTAKTVQCAARVNRSFSAMRMILSLMSGSPWRRARQMGFSVATNLRPECGMIAVDLVRDRGNFGAIWRRLEAHRRRHGARKAARGATPGAHGEAARFWPIKQDSRTRHSGRATFGVLPGSGVPLAGLSGGQAGGSASGRFAVALGSPPAPASALSLQLRHSNPRAARSARNSPGPVKCNACQPAARAPSTLRKLSSMNRHSSGRSPLRAVSN